MATKMSLAAAWVAAHPGCTAVEIADGIGCPHAAIHSTISELLKRTAFRAGPARPARYFPTKAEADAAHAQLLEERAQQARDIKAAAVQRALAKRRERMDAREAAGLNRWPTRIKVSPYAALDESILKAASTVGGFHCLATETYSHKVIQARCTKLISQNRLHAARAGHRTVRYFTDAARAARWAQENQTVHAKRSEAAKSGLTWRGATLSKDTPVQIPATVKVQVIPHRPGRYEVTGPIERAITNDWLAERMGATSANPSHHRA